MFIVNKLLILYNNLTRYMDIFESLNQMGIITADLGLLMFVIWIIIVIVIAIYFAHIDNCWNGNEKYFRVNGKVVELNHDNIMSNILVKYELDGKKYDEYLYFTGKIPHVIGSLIDLMVSKSNHHFLKPFENLTQTYTFDMLIVALVFGVVIYLNYYLSHNYKTYSVIQGVVIVLFLLKLISQFKHLFVVTR